MSWQSRYAAIGFWRVGTLRRSDNAIAHDTDITPYKDVTGGSRTTLTAGKAVQLAAERLEAEARYLEARGRIFVQGHPEISVTIAELSAESTFQRPSSPQHRLLPTPSEVETMIDESRDAYGAELLNYLQTGQFIEIVERGDGYIDYSDGIRIYFASFEEWSDSERKAIGIAKGHVLDIGSGAGRVSLYIQSKGYSVTAIDNSPGAIMVCRERGIMDARLIPFEKVNRELALFDSFTLFGNNFGLFGSFKRARWLLGKLKAISSKEALIIAHVTDPYKTDNPDHLKYHEFNLKRGRMAGQLRIRIRHKSIIGNWFDYLFVSKQELEAILHGTGWTVQEYLDISEASYFAVINKRTLP